MSYQVLARKYRPASFAELEGQEHVLRALVNALDNNRLHHAYLFTGTRGVGKTTIARILAKCLNCDKGISAVPCGECSTCLEIAEGRSVDLIEVDAASRTKVEDTRELLDNVQYLPSKNRFKIYLIDEVHMLSNHSFNALLKTLEEPPEHVKFLLATTDPKKLPVTVLSRCLQFNLKNLSPERIVSYLKQILPIEHVEFDEAALWQIGRAADGSMRDALSLTDQAISYGNDAVRDAEVKAMLGSIDQREVFGLIEGLINKDASAILGKIADLAEYSPDYVGLLAELLAVFHRITLAHAMPDNINNTQGDRALVEAAANALSPEDVQLYYQIGLLGQRDLPHAPDLRSGFEMVMLRMLTFTPNPQQAATSTEKKTVKFAGGLGKPSPGPEKTAEIEAQVSAVSKDTISEAHPVSADAEPEDSTIIDFDDDGTSAPVQSAPSSRAEKMASVRATLAQAIETSAKAEATSSSAAGQTPPSTPAQNPNGIESNHSDAAPAAVVNSPVQSETPVALPVSDTKLAQAAETDESSVQAPEVNEKKEPCIALSVENWSDLLPALGLAGVTLSVASNCILTEATSSSCTLSLSEQHASLWNKSHESRIENALGQYYGHRIALKIEIGDVTGETPAQIEEQRQKEALEEAVKLIESDEKVKQLIDSFDGRLDKTTITTRH